MSNDLKTQFTIIVLCFIIRVPDRHKCGSVLGVSSSFLLSVSSTILIRQWLCPHNCDAASHQVLKQSLSLKKVTTDTAAMVFENLCCFQSQQDSRAWPRQRIYTYIYRVIAMPNVKYSGRVETDVLGGARRVASQPS